MREMKREVLKYDENANLSGHRPAVGKFSKAVLPWELPREHRACQITAESGHQGVVDYALNSCSPHQISPACFVSLPRPWLVLFDFVLLKNSKFISIHKPESQIHQ
jgi:hypothetical protein